VERWDRYFFSKEDRKDVDFRIDLPGGKRSFDALDESVVRDFREYAIPTIEINLTDESSLDEIINLFVDINQQGVPVNRFDIVKAMGRTNALLRSVFKLIAQEQRRGQDIYYKSQRNDITFVLKKLQIVDNLNDDNSRVDRMWERLLEIALFQRTKRHRKPAEILRSFISLRERQPRLSKPEVKKVRTLFECLAEAYRTSELGSTRLATDQTHFYILVTSLIGSDTTPTLTGNSELIDTIARPDLIGRLVTFGKIIDEKIPVPRSRALAKVIKNYLELSAKQTTDVSRRQDREDKFIEAIKLLGEHMPSNGTPTEV
jgi:translation elongation factor EF-1beta